MAEIPFAAPISPMEARVRDTIPVGAWAYEPKWDGFRCLSWSTGRLDSRSAKPLLRYFPELEPALAALPSGTVVDGEVVVVQDGRLDFDALSNRIHPAESRIRLLSEQTPAELVAFDLLAHDGEDLRGRPFRERRERLAGRLALELPDPWHLTPSSTDIEDGRRWFTEFESAGCDGVVCKALDDGYIEGKRAMVKVKHRRTVDCVIGGYRVHKEGDRVGSLLLGLHTDDGQLHFIGHCSGFSDTDRVKMLDLLRDFEADEGFGQTVRRPGEPSRWTGDKDLSWVPLRPELVCEVSYDQLTGERFRHATRFERWRGDKEPADCRLDQLERPNGPAFDDIIVT